MGMTTRTRRRNGSAGFTYIGVLLLIAFMGVALGLVGEVWRTVQMREAERDLRFIGNEFRRAIGRYYQSTPGPVKRFPNSLSNLLNDDRYPGTRRYLRRIYRDPITNRPDWGLVKAPEGGIAGVYSLSEDEPIGLFVPGVGGAEVANVVGVGPETPTTKAKNDAKKPQYADWKFVYTPPAPAAPPRPPGTTMPANGVSR